MFQEFGMNSYTTPMTGLYLQHMKSSQTDHKKKKFEIEIIQLEKENTWKYQLKTLRYEYYSTTWFQFIPW